MHQLGSKEHLQNLREEVNAFVGELFEDYIPNPQNTDARNDGKVIRDPIHGFHHLDPWEIEVLDSPLAQRLRYIHQNALAYLVYPSANHSRLEHSLGMAKVVQDVTRAFRDTTGGRQLFDDNTVGELRLSALLHDVGHGIFSHLSEGVIETHWYDQFSAIRNEPPFEGKDAGEILSFLLVTSPTFKDFLNDVIARHSLAFNVERLAGYILGRTDEPALDRYKADLITGPIDADKLDYLPRDSYFTGIRSEVDVAHIIRSLEVWPQQAWPGRCIVIKLSGANSVEQMHFARLLLFPAMYHHQKVRALECMLKGIFETIWSDPAAITDSALRFERITDFLRINDSEFLALAERERNLRQQARRLKNRRLLRRALHISASVVEGAPEDNDYSNLVNLGGSDPGSQNEITNLRREIFDLLPSDARIGPSDIWLDVPPTPKISRDILRCFVDTGEVKPLPLRELFPIDAWLQSYAENKWTAHVFGYPSDDHLKTLNRAAITVLQDHFNLKFSDRASRECKLEPPE